MRKVLEDFSVPCSCNECELLSGKLKSSSPISEENRDIPPGFVHCLPCLWNYKGDQRRSGCPSLLERLRLYYLRIGWIGVRKDGSRKE